MSGAVEWKTIHRLDGSTYTEAHAGPYVLHAHDDGRWYVICGETWKEGKAADLPSAQSAAIAAAVGLLVEALCAVPVDDARGFAITPDRSTRTPGFYNLCDARALNLVQVIGRLDGDDLFTIARLCIAAGVAARGGG